MTGLPVQKVKQTCVLACAKQKIGRVIGRQGETIRALQAYTGALIQIDQALPDVAQVTISGFVDNLELAVAMITDVVNGTFKGFALLKQYFIARQACGSFSITSPVLDAPGTRPIYAQGYGLIPPTQVNADSVSPLGFFPLSGGGEEDHLRRGVSDSFSIPEWQQGTSQQAPMNLADRWGYGDSGSQPGIERMIFPDGNSLQYHDQEAKHMHPQDQQQLFEHHLHQQQQQHQLSDINLSFQSLGLQDRVFHQPQHQPQLQQLQMQLQHLHQQQRRQMTVGGSAGAAPINISTSSGIDMGSAVGMTMPSGGDGSFLLNGVDGVVNVSALTLAKGNSGGSLEQHSSPSEVRSPPIKHASMSSAHGSSGGVSGTSPHNGMWVSNSACTTSSQLGQVFGAKSPTVLGNSLEAEAGLGLGGAAVTMARAPFDTRGVGIFSNRRSSVGSVASGSGMGGFMDGVAPAVAPPMLQQQPRPLGLQALGGGGVDGMAPRPITLPPGTLLMDDKGQLYTFN